MNAKSRGFSDVLYLDSVNGKDIEEVSSCNIFMVKVWLSSPQNSSADQSSFNGLFEFMHLLLPHLQGNTISTPTTKGTILPGVTRKSIIEIARDHGYTVSCIHTSIVNSYIILPHAEHSLRVTRSPNHWQTLQVEERSIPIEELLEADEVFCTGTAVVVASVGSITYQGERYSPSSLLQHFQLYVVIMFPKLSTMCCNYIHLFNAK